MMYKMSRFVWTTRCDFFHSRKNFDLYFIYQRL